MGHTIKPAGAQNVTILSGDLFQSEAQTLTNAVNTVGVMGKGIAAVFKKRYPDMYADYTRRCQAGTVKLGEPYLFNGSLFGKWVLNFPTKAHWRQPSELESIRTGFRYLRSHITSWGITSLAVPALGCGAGGLDWETVMPVIYEGAANLGVPVEIYSPV